MLTVSALMFLRTTSLDQDDRVLKEATEVLRDGNQVTIHVLENANQARNGKTATGVPFTSTWIASRVLPSGRFIALKMLELHTRFFFKLLRTRTDVVWVHNLELFGMVWLAALLKRFGRVGTVIWDQHELPTDQQLQNRWFCRAFKLTCSACDNIIVANQERGKLLTDRELIEWDKIAVVENFASEGFGAEGEIDRLPEEFITWKGDQPYIVAQGAATPNRYFEQLLEAFSQRDERVVVIGGNREQLHERTRSEFGEELASRMYYTGWIPQASIPMYLIGAEAGVILYSTRTLNGKYCAPNRLYQALACGLPVLVGCNPPLQNIVNAEKAGVVLEADGRDVDDIRAGLDKLKQHLALAEKKGIPNQRSYVFNIDNVRSKVPTLSGMTS